MEDDFPTIRFILFTKSYAGYRIKNFILNSNEQRTLIKNLASALLFDEKNVKCFILHKTCRRKFNKIHTQDRELKQKINIYIQIERELIVLSQAKSDKSDFAEEYEYGEGLLSPAIEHVAGDCLKSIENDHKFESEMSNKINECRNWYYEIACKYGLPTMRIVPFLIRVMDLKVWRYNRVEK